MARFYGICVSVLAVLLHATTSQANSYCIEARYDNLTAQTGVPVDTTFTYEYLTYSMFYIGSTSNLTGVQAQSPPNTLNFRPTDVARHSITPASPYKTFDLYSFYFGCVLFTGENVAVVPQNCVVSVYGVYPDGSFTGVETFGYFTDNMVVAPMFKAVLVPLLGVKEIRLGVPASASTPDTTIPKFDNLDYCLH